MSAKPFSRKNSVSKIFAEYHCLVICILYLTRLLRCFMQYSANRDVALWVRCPATTVSRGQMDHPSGHARPPSEPSVQPGLYPFPRRPLRSSFPPTDDATITEAPPSAARTDRVRNFRNCPQPSEKRPTERTNDAK